jgi:hypothetical protein
MPLRRDRQSHVRLRSGPASLLLEARPYHPMRYNAGVQHTVIMGLDLVAGATQTRSDPGSRRGRIFTAHGDRRVGHARSPDQASY